MTLQCRLESCANAQTNVFLGCRQRIATSWERFMAKKCLAFANIKKIQSSTYVTYSQTCKAFHENARSTGSGGQKLQTIVDGGYWKASKLMTKCCSRLNQKNRWQLPGLSNLLSTFYQWCIPLWALNLLAWQQWRTRKCNTETEVIRPEKIETTGTEKIRKVCEKYKLFIELVLVAHDPSFNACHAFYPEISPEWELVPLVDSRPTSLLSVPEILPTKRPFCFLAIASADSPWRHRQGIHASITLL